MKADEIRAIANRYRATADAPKVPFEVEMEFNRLTLLGEIAAQLAELNENLAPFRNRTKLLAMMAATIAAPDNGELGPKPLTDFAVTRAVAILAAVEAEEGSK